VPTYERLAKTHHKHYQPDYWAKIRALYAGGCHLLEDKKLLESLFPRHLAEEDWVYEERKKRAFYIPYMGLLCDFMPAALGGDPLKLVPTPKTTDPFYTRFFDDCSKPGGERVVFSELIRETVLTALLTRRAWALVDLPEVSKDDPEPRSRFEEETLGRLDAYVVAVDPESVIDWERDAAGELKWANICTVERPRDSIDDTRSRVIETYTVYDRNGWARYIVTYDDAKGPPKPKTEIPLASSGAHSFGRVPLASMRLKPGLWAGNKLESVAREHLNKRCALSWGIYRSLFQILVANLAGPDPTNPITENADRAIDQAVGPGRMMILGGNDKLAFAAPDAEPYRVAAEDLATLRDEMFRVLEQMARSVDNTGAALKRSAASKQADASSTSIVLRAIGILGRKFAVDILDLVSRGRGDQDLKWSASGFDQFDDVSMDSFISEAGIVETMSIPSQAFQVDYKFELARRLVPGASEDRLKQYRQELERNITAEDMTPPAVDDDADQAGPPAAPLSDAPPTTPGPEPTKAKRPKTAPKKKPPTG
jgi:hypothetical protein